MKNKGRGVCRILRPVCALCSYWDNTASLRKIKISAIGCKPWLLLCQLSGWFIWFAMWFTRAMMQLAAHLWWVLGCTPPGVLPHLLPGAYQWKSSAWLHLGLSHPLLWSHILGIWYFTLYVSMSYSVSPSVHGAMSVGAQIDAFLVIFSYSAKSWSMWIGCGTPCWMVFYFLIIFLNIQTFRRSCLVEFILLLLVWAHNGPMYHSNLIPPLTVSSCSWQISKKKTTGKEKRKHIYW